MDESRTFYQEDTNTDVETAFDALDSFACEKKDGPDSFKFDSLQDVVSASMTEQENWSSDFSSINSGYLVSEKKGEREWIFGSENGQQQSLTKSVNGMEGAERHTEILNELYEQGWSVKERFDTFSSSQVREIYFADKKGNISFQTFKFSKKNSLEAVGEDYDLDFDDPVLESLNQISNQTQKSEDKTSPRKPKAVPKPTAWEKFWSELLKKSNKNETGDTSASETPNIFTLISKPLTLKNEQPQKSASSESETKPSPTEQTPAVKKTIIISTLDTEQSIAPTTNTELDLDLDTDVNDNTIKVLKNNSKAVISSNSGIKIISSKPIELPSVGTTEINTDDREQSQRERQSIQKIQKEQELSAQETVATLIPNIKDEKIKAVEQDVEKDKPTITINTYGQASVRAKAKASTSQTTASTKPDEQTRPPVSESDVISIKEQASTEVSELSLLQDKPEQVKATIDKTGVVQVKQSKSEKSKPADTLTIEETQISISEEVQVKGLLKERESNADKTQVSTINRVSLAKPAKKPTLSTLARNTVQVSEKSKSPTTKEQSQALKAETKPEATKPDPRLRKIEPKVLATIQKPRTETAILELAVEDKAEDLTQDERAQDETPIVEQKDYPKKQSDSPIVKLVRESSILREMTYRRSEASKLESNRKTEVREIPRQLATKRQESSFIKRPSQYRAEATRKTEIEETQRQSITKRQEPRPIQQLQQRVESRAYITKGTLRTTARQIANNENQSTLSSISLISRKARNNILGAKKTAPKTQKITSIEQKLELPINKPAPTSFSSQIQDNELELISSSSGIRLAA